MINIVRSHLREERERERGVGWDEGMREGGREGRKGGVTLHMECYHGVRERLFDLKAKDRFFFWLQQLLRNGLGQVISAVNWTTGLYMR